MSARTPTINAKRPRKRAPTRKELMWLYLNAERTEPQTAEFLTWMAGIRASAPIEQQIVGGA